MATQQINKSVGRGGVNAPADVEKVQTLLKSKKVYEGRVDKICGSKTITAIEKFQAHFMRSPDGRVDANGTTWKKLTGMLPMGAALPAQAASTDNTERLLSGRQWVNQYPTSRSTTDLSAAFRSKADNFLSALRTAGASVSITATLRPRERAMLMHLAWKVAKGTMTPAEATTHCEDGMLVKGQLTKVPINWVHATDAESKQAAKDMVQGYGLVHPASLGSNHIVGDAIDLSISWNGNLSIVNGSGQTVVISTTPRTGADNTQLHDVGKSYGVLKLVSDRPHWSRTGG